MLKSFLVTALSFVAVQNVQAKTAIPGTLAIENAQPNACYQDDKKVNCVTGQVLAFYNLAADSKTKLSEQESIENFFDSKGSQMGIRNWKEELKQNFRLETPGGLHIRYQQMQGEVPVAGGDVVLNLDKNNNVTHVMSNYRANLAPLSKFQNKKAMSVLSAQIKVVNALGFRPSATLTVSEPALTLLKKDGKSYLTYKMLVSDMKQKTGKFEAYIDASTGALVDSKDILMYFDGSAMVYEPDPVSHLRMRPDNNNDQNSDVLSKARTPVTLENIKSEFNKYSLIGPYVKIDNDPDTAYTQDSTKFEFERNERGFEAANAYYHISKSLKYVNEDLGYKAMPITHSGGVVVDPHYYDADNSFFDGSDDKLSFGDGGVNDAEDMDVILHELGHGIHSWLTNGNLSNVEGVSEGSGDYWAVSSRRPLISSDQQEYNWVFAWDGHNEFWDGRVVNYSKNYSNMEREIHLAGQVWATALMKIWNQVGKKDTDRLFLETLSMLNSTANQKDAAQAFLKAEHNLYNDQHLDIIKTAFKEAGYIQ